MQALFVFTLLVVVVIVVPGADADEAAVAGTFVGVNNHQASGGVRVESTAEGARVTLGPDFSFDGAPDPKLAFGFNGYDRRFAIFSPLRANRGAQEYAVPADLDTSQFNEVWIWCERYDVPLGVAKRR